MEEALKGIGLSFAIPDQTAHETTIRADDNVRDLSVRIGESSLQHSLNDYGLPIFQSVKIALHFDYRYDLRRGLRVYRLATAQRHNRARNQDHRLVHTSVVKHFCSEPDSPQWVVFRHQLPAQDRTPRTFRLGGSWR